MDGKKSIETRSADMQQKTSYEMEGLPFTGYRHRAIKLIFLQHPQNEILDLVTKKVILSFWGSLFLLG